MRLCRYLCNTRENKCPLYFTDEIKGHEKLTQKIAHVLSQALGLNPKVKIVEPQTLVRSEGKAVHVIDKRKLY